MQCYTSPIPPFPVQSPPWAARANKPLKMIASFPTIKPNPLLPPPRSCASFWAFFSFYLEKTKSGGSRGDPPPWAARGWKDCGYCWWVVVVARRVGKAGRKSEGRAPSPLSSISDKNKVNAANGVAAEGWLLLQHRDRRGGWPGRVATGEWCFSGQTVSKRKGKGKKYGDRCYRSRGIQWRRAPLRFSVSPRS